MKRVVFVGHDTEELAALRRMVGSESAELHTSFFGHIEGAWEHILESLPDAVMIHAAMPQGVGLELLTRIRSTEDVKRLPVAMIVPKASRSMKEEAIAQGASDLLCVPFDAFDLHTRINSLLRLNFLQRTLRACDCLLEEKVRERTEGQFQSQAGLVWRLGKTAESRSGMPGNHVIRMGYLSRVVAEQMQLSPQFTEHLALGAPLHDIGFLGVPDVILMKRGELTSRESDIVRMHCQIGHRILSEGNPGVNPEGSHAASGNGKDMLEVAATIAWAHHEKWDGKGYPRQLAGEQIPLEARIVAICDVFDSMTSRRPFREPYPEDVALEVIRNASGTHFAPEVLGAFMAALPEIRSIKREFPDRGEEQPELGEIWEASESWPIDDFEEVGV